MNWTYKVQVKKSFKNNWYWRIIARNGEVLCHSQRYFSNKKGASKTAGKIFQSLIGSEYETD